MSDPHVTAIMLVADRRDLGERAVECFRRQTYENKSLLIFDTGKEPFWSTLSHMSFGTVSTNAINGRERLWRENSLGRTVGELRNRAAWISGARADIIVHWDSDDWSHPRRIEEQVALLKASSVACVGYSDMLFWREGEPARYGPISDLEPARLGDAWLWRGAQNRPIGTSLCYWRRIWEAYPFEHLPTLSGSLGEDVDFTRRVECAAVPSWPFYTIKLDFVPPPRMIARIHAGNTSTGYREIKSSSSWSRVPAFDDFCRKVMV